MLPFILISPIYAEEPEQGEVIIQTDGTYNDHQVIEACEVGKMVKLDIGSFDTAYINNNFDFNANNNGYVYFECAQYNDIKLAYYGINQTIFSDDLTGLTDAQLNVLENLVNNEVDNATLFISSFGSIFYSYNVTAYNGSSIRVNGYYALNNTSTEPVYYDSAPTWDLTNQERFLYLKFNGVTYHSVEIPILFEDIASIYINPIFDSYSQNITSIDAPEYTITYSNNKMTLDGHIECAPGYTTDGNCYKYEFGESFQTGPNQITTYPYASITLPQIFFTNSNFNSNLDVTGYNVFTFHYEVLITFDNDYQGYLEFQDIGRFYVNGHELRFNKTTTQAYTDPDMTINLVLTDYSLKRSNVLVDGTEESKDSEQANNAMNDNLNNTVSNFEAVEQSYNDSIDSGLNSIDFEAVNFGDSFLQSSSFVVSAFDAIVMSSPLGDYLTIVLIIGLFLLIVGRYL